MALSSINLNGNEMLVLAFAFLLCTGTVCALYPILNNIKQINTAKPVSSDLSIAHVKVF